MRYDSPSAFEHQLRTSTGKYWVRQRLMINRLLLFRALFGSEATDALVQERLVKGDKVDGSDNY